MPGLCALVAPRLDVVLPSFERMLARLKPFPWFTTARDARPDEGVAVGAVVPDRPAPPSCTRAGKLTVWFDGEIYGANGSCGADTLLDGWTRDGDRFLRDLDGLFSAVIWDRDARELTVVTDRFGMKPIHVAQGEHAFALASEIKALVALPGIDRSWSDEGVAQFFAFGHFFNDDTFFRGVRALPPATRLTYRAADGRIDETRYWEPNGQPSRASRSDQLDALDRQLVAAIGRRARHGEHLGLSLSGGLDARTLLGLMPSGVNLTSVCIGIDGGIDHRGATELARLAGVPHHPYVLDEKFLSSFETHLRQMIGLTDGHYLDQGIVMPTLPTYRSLGIEFLLRGHGGELLHMTKAYAFSLDAAALQASEAELERWLDRHLTAYMLAGVPPDIFAIDVRGLAERSLRRALARTKSGASPVDRVWQLFLNERLHRETALSMHLFGCFAAVRLPYVDNGVIDTLFAMPAHMKLDDELQTELLRRHKPAFLDVVNSNTGARMGAGRLERELARFRMRVAAKLGVKGYQPYERLGLWLKQDLRPLVERVLLGESLLSRGLFRPDSVRRVVDEHLSSRANHTFLLMSLLIFEMGQQMLGDPEAFTAASPPSIG